MSYDEMGTTAVQEQYWKTQANKIASFLVDQGMNSTTARYKANECVKTGLTYNEFISTQGDVYRFENNSIRAKEEPRKEVVINNNVKKKTADKKVVKKIMGAALIVTFVAVTFVGAKNLSSINTNDKFGELSANIVSTQYEQREDIDILEDASYEQINEMANEIVGRHKQIEYDGYNLPESTINYDGLSRDILSICSNHPEYFDSVMFNVYSNLSDAGLENDNPDEDLRTSNQFYHMDNLIKVIKPLADKYGYDEIYNELAHTTSMADLMLGVTGEVDHNNYNKYGEIAREYNEIAHNTAFNYAYSHLSDTKDMNSLIKEYRGIMNKKVASQIDSINKYYEEIKNNASLGIEDEGMKLS